MSSRPLSDDLLKKNIFSVPEGYFDNFSNQLQSIISEKSCIAWRNSRMSFFTHKLKFISIVILCILIAGIFWRYADSIFAVGRMMNNPLDNEKFILIRNNQLHELYEEEFTVEEIELINTYWEEEKTYEVYDITVNNEDSSFFLF